MQNRLKVNGIFIRLSEMITLTTQYNKDDGLYCDYDTVIKLLDAAADVMNNHPHMIRPANITDDIPWSDACNPEDQSTPFEYKADMSIEEYEKMRTAYDLDHQSENEVMDGIDFQIEKKAEELAHAEEETETLFYNS